MARNRDLARTLRPTESLLPLTPEDRAEVRSLLGLPPVAAPSASLSHVVAHAHRSHRPRSQTPLTPT